MILGVDPSRSHAINALILNWLASISRVFVALPNWLVPFQLFYFLDSCISFIQKYTPMTAAYFEVDGSLATTPKLETAVRYGHNRRGAI